MATIPFDRGSTEAFRGFAHSRAGRRRYQVFKLYDGEKSLEECLRMNNDEVTFHLIMEGAYVERENDRHDERRKELGLDEQMGKPDNIPEDLWNRMGPKLKQQARQRNYNPEMIRKHLDAMDEQNQEAANT